MSKKKLLSQNRPKRLFKPSIRRNSRQSSRYLSKNVNKNITFENFKDTNIESNDSHRYGDKDAMVSTQEINIDYSDFTNHTFFHSAVAKVNESFDIILNEFPYGGTNKEIEQFEDKLTGYEKYVYDVFPKNTGYLIFSGTQKGESQNNGTYIDVKDLSSVVIPSISSNKIAKSICNPGLDPLNIQFFINIPKEINDNQIIMQKRESLAYNFNLALSSSSDTEKCDLLFTINSGSNSLTASGSIEKGSFVHVTAEYHDCNQFNSLMMLSDSIVDHLYFTSSNRVLFKNIKPVSSLTIGKGDTFRIDADIFTPQQSLSGSIDEFRLIHRAIDKKEIKKYYKRSINGHDGIKLYFKFNEPSGSYAGSNIALDASGNNLSSEIQNYIADYSRITGSHDANPVSMENIKHSPVLFPKFPQVSSLNESLLADATLYDDVNPNLITKLIPSHYFELGNEQENYKEVLGKISKSFSEYNTIRPAANTQTSVQLLAKLLLSWAKTFDEIKIFIDHFSKVNFVEYEEYETVSNKLIERLGTHLGISLPKLFGNGNIDQVFNGYDLKNNPANSVKSLYEVQNLIWRRILSDVSNITKTKGNLDAIRSVFRSSGIEAENIFNFREYGGSKKRSLNGSRESKKDVINFLNFSGSIGNLNLGTLNAQGYSSTTPKVKTSFLSSSRLEPGNPKIAGNYVDKTRSQPHGISNNKSDGLFTTSSFSVFGYYLFDKTFSHNDKQSLFRLNITGSNSDSDNEGSIINLVANKNENKLIAYISDGISDTTVSNLYLTGANLFDGDSWAIGLSKKAGIETSNSVKDKYTLSAGKYIAGKRQEYYQTSSFVSCKSDSVLSNISERNTSGSFVVIGSQSLGTSTKFINSGTDDEKQTIFSGQVSYFNFWSKSKEKNEFLGYAKNPNSVGVNNPSINYNFSINESGSFERLRIQTLGKQFTTASDVLGNIRLFDFTQNNLHLEGDGFEPLKTVMSPSDVIYEILSENFDLNSSKDKIRIRSLQDKDYLDDNEFALTSPVYETPQNEEVFDDTRFSIDMSVMKGLNENIMTIFPDFQPLDNALGMPNSIFGNEYVDITSFRRVYFNNVIEDLDLSRYRTLFKWIDNAYTDLVYSLVPRTTNFLGINFIYESHVLERNKIRYNYDEIYLKSLAKDCNRVPLLLSQYVSKICKF